MTADDGTEIDARVAELLGAPRVTDWNKIKAFMAAVVAWPSPGEPGYVNLANSFKASDTADGKRRNGKGYPVSDGVPFSGIDKFLSRVRWHNTLDRIKDQWFCTSLQSEAKPHPQNNSKLKAVRTKTNALKLRSIWIDVDVKDDEKHYHTLADALKAVFDFASHVGLPSPSALVATGSGLHAYWISHADLTVSQWAPYAHGLKALVLQHGLKCDAGLTTDQVRILRVPGTFNHKYDPPREVQLLDQPLTTYDFDTQLQVLAGAAPTARPARAAHSIFAEGVTSDAFKGGPAFTIEGEPGLEAGIETSTKLPLDPHPIFRQCGFFREALFTGGATYDNPRWMLSVLGTTFMRKGEEIAHTISRGHRTYSVAETQTLYERKLAERKSRKIGPPMCETIKGFGCKSCCTCPLFGKIRSPLSIRGVVTATVTGPDDAGAAGSSRSQRPPKPGISLKQIPHRKWLYGIDAVRGELTVIGSPGGAGKSSLAIGMAACIASARDLLGEKIHGSELSALVINGEDSTDELRRRLAAFSSAHSLTEQDLQRLTAAGADDDWVKTISLLKVNEKNVSTLNQDGLRALEDGLEGLRPDLVVLDPLVSFCAGGNLNDNAAMSLVMRSLKQIAGQYDCAVLIVHHTRKGGDVGNVEAIGGAGVITNLARRAIMPAPLNAQEVLRNGVLPSESFQYFKLVDAKSNLAPRSSNSPTYHLLNVELPNAEPPLYPHGDRVQAIVRFVPAVSTAGTATSEDLRVQHAIFDLVDRGKEIEGQSYPYSPSAAGANNARSLLPDAMAAVEHATAPRQWHPDDLEAVTKAAIDKMKEDGRLVVKPLSEILGKTQRFRRGWGLTTVAI